MKHSAVIFEYFSLLKPLDETFSSDFRIFLIAHASRWNMWADVDGIWMYLVAWGTAFGLPYLIALPDLPWLTLPSIRLCNQGVFSALASCRTSSWRQCIPERKMSRIAVYSSGHKSFWNRRSVKSWEELTGGSLFMVVLSTTLMGTRNGLELSVVIVVLKWSRSLYLDGFSNPQNSYVQYTCYMELENRPWEKETLFQTIHFLRFHLYFLGFVYMLLLLLLSLLSLLFTFVNDWLALIVRCGAIAGFCTGHRASDSEAEAEASHQGSICRHDCQSSWRPKLADTSATKVQRFVKFHTNPRFSHVE